MTKQEFLKRLEAGLAGSSNAREVLDYYREMIEDRMEEDVTEEEAVAQLGSLADILAQCVQDLTVPKPEQDAEIKRVVIREREFDLVIAPSEEGFRLEGSEEKNHTVTLENGTLRILRNKESVKRFFLGGGDTLKLYLPRGMYESLDVTTASGDVEVSADFRRVSASGASGDVTLKGSFPDYVEIRTTSGDIELTGTVGGVDIQASSGDVCLSGRFGAAVQAKTTSGDLSVSAANFGAAEVQSSSGDVELRNVLAASLRARSISGDMELDRVCAEDLTVEGKSGDMNLTDTLSKGNFRCETVSGDIELSRVDGAELEFTTVSGNISGSLRRGKRFVGRTVSGSMYLPKTEAPEICRVTTVSGDAELRVEE